MTSEEHAEVKRLKAENRQLREDVEILRAATASWESSTPATADHGIHRHHAQRGPRGRVGLSVLREQGLSGRRADLPVVEGADRAGSPEFDQAHYAALNPEGSQYESGRNPVTVQSRVSTIPIGEIASSRVASSGRTGATSRGSRSGGTAQ